MLRCLKAHTDDPAWSSFLIEKLFTVVMAVPGGAIGDAILAMYDVLRAHNGSISPPTGRLIVEVVVGAFSRHRASFEASDLTRMKDDLAAPGSRITPGQAYLALNALPDATLMAQRDRVLALLRDTSYMDDAQKMLQPEDE